MWPHGCCGLRRARPPARLGDLTSFGAAPRSPPVPSGPSGALHTGGAWRAGVWTGALSRSPARPCHRPSISHVIPLRLVQTLNWYRWNCNVFGVSRKMTAINYVRNLGGGGVVAARGHHSQAPPLPVGVMGFSRVEFWGALVRVVTNVVNPRRFSCGFLIRCYKRRQSEGFFAENGGFWAWIDDVCNRGSHEVI